MTELKPTSLFKDTGSECGEKTKLEMEALLTEEGQEEFHQDAQVLPMSQAHDDEKQENRGIQHLDVEATPITLSQISAAGRPKRNAGKPRKFCTPTPRKQAVVESDTSVNLSWEEDVPCSICLSMGEDNDLVSWIQCSYCTVWCHGACVDLQFNDEGAKGIVRFKCPACRSDSSLSNDEEEYQNLINENEEMVHRIDKLNLLVDQERGEIEGVKRK